MNITEIKALLDRYLSGSASPGEEELIEQWLEEAQHPHNDWETMSRKDKAAWLASLYQDTLESIRDRPALPQDDRTNKHILPVHRRSWRFLLQAAAVVILLAGAGAFYLLYRGGTHPPAIAGVPHPNVRHDIAPGSSRAVLTLADGRTITLDSTQKGIVAQQGNAAISKDGEQLIYKGVSGGSPEIAYNTLATPRGGQYRLVLPDGSRVWLNAASSIRYPTTFTGEQRRVEVTGEVYFEIASLPSPDGKKTKWPFQVMINTAQQNNKRATIDVLGTHFNINAYDDEPDINTTLLEGSIKMTAFSASQDAMATTRQLIPGQEARVDKKGDLKVQAGHIEEAVAWKDGLFLMDKTDIGTVLRQLARWYDVEIVYNAGIPKGRITGDIPRNMHLTDALKVLQLSGVRLSLEGSKILVDH